MSRFELIACVIGIGVGLAAGRIAHRVSRRLGDDGFWLRLARVSRALLDADSEISIIREYVQLWAALCKFVIRTAVTMLLALSPVLLGFVGLETAANRYTKPIAALVAITPVQSVVVNLAGQSLTFDSKNPLIPATMGLDAPAVINVQHGSMHCNRLARKQAYASRVSDRLVLFSLGFELLPLVPADASIVMVLIRPFNDDNNALWPYLSDWEFDFFVSVGLASVAGTFLSKRRTAGKTTSLFNGKP